jgi:hypothetical protein
VEKPIVPVEKPVENFASGLGREIMKIYQNLTEQFCLWKTLKISDEKKISKVKKS